MRPNSLSPHISFTILLVSIGLIAFLFLPHAARAMAVGEILPLGDSITDGLGGTGGGYRARFDTFSLITPATHLTSLVQLQITRRQRSLTVDNIIMKAIPAIVSTKSRAILPDWFRPTRCPIIAMAGIGSMAGLPRNA